MSAGAKSKKELLEENEELKLKLEEATETIEAIRYGKVDALVVNIENESKIYSLKSADHTYRVFIEKMKEGAVSLATDGTILYTNSSLAQILNLPLQNVIGKSFESFLPKQYKADFERLFKEAFGKDTKAELSLYDNEKKLIPFLVSFTKLDLDGHESISLILTDLSIQKKIENELKHKNELLEEAERLSKIGSWEWDFEKNKLIRSNELYMIYGLDPMGDNSDEIDLNRIYEEDREQYINDIKKAIESDDSFGLNCRINTNSGEIKSVIIRGKILRKNGKPFKIIGSTQDVSELKNIEKELQEKNKQLINAQKITSLLNHELEDKVQARTTELLLSKEHFRFLADNIPQVVWQAQPNGEIVFFNKHWFDYTGLSKTEAYGWNWQNVIHPDDANQNMNAWKHSIETGEPLEIEHRLKSKSGEYRWHIGRAQAMRNEKGVIEMWIGTNADIQDQKMAIEKKDEFIGIASHELKTPLTSAQAYLQLLQRNVTETTNRTYVEKANKHIGKLNELITDLLDVSKIQAGKLVLSKTKFDFDSFITDCIEGFQYTSSSHKIYLEGKTGCMIEADRHRIEQVLINFLSNAIKYSPKSNKVKVILNVENNSVEVSVKDYGIGIPSDKLDHVFQKFYRVKGVSKNFEGLGIGLFISSEIIKRHNGTVRVESQENQGSVFTFTLPKLGNK